MNDEQAAVLRKKLKELLTEKGYDLLEESVDGKNQSRYIHLILEKGGKRFFGKVNIRREQLLDIKNESLSELLDESEHFQFLKPVETLEVDTHSVLLIYPFIHLPAISSESSDFSQFTIDTSDVDAFYQAVNEAFSQMEDKKLYSYRDVGSANEVRLERIAEWITKLSPEDTAAVEALQVVTERRGSLTTFAPSVGDTQPQNMFWDPVEKKVILFDLEVLQNRPLYFDIAKLAASFWIVCNRAEFAEGLIRYSTKRLGSTNKIGGYHLMMLLSGLEYYFHFKKVSEAHRVKLSLEFIEWLLQDFAEVANTMIADSE